MSYANFLGEDLGQNGEIKNASAKRRFSTLARPDLRTLSSSGVELICSSFTNFGLAELFSAFNTDSSESGKQSKLNLFA